MAHGGMPGTLRAGQLGLLQIQFFNVQTQLPLDLLTVAEWHQLQTILDNPSLPGIFVFYESFETRRTKIHAAGS